MTRRDTTRHSSPPDSFCPGLPSSPVASPLLLFFFSSSDPISLSRAVGSTGFGRNLTCCIFEARLHSHTSPPSPSHHASLLCHTHCGTRSPFLFPFCLSRCHPASLMVTLHPDATSGLVWSTAGKGAPSFCFPSHCPSRCTAGTSIRQQVRASHTAAHFEHRPSASVAPRASSR